MNAFNFIRLLRSILDPSANVNAREIERMGLLAVKVAQMYAVRADLVDARKCVELTRLLQNTSPLPPNQFVKRWRDLAPRRFRTICAMVEPVPLASASVGQVHRATLRDGREVVVKVSRADERAQFLRDVNSAKLLIRIALLFYPRLARLADPLGTLEAVERQTLVEMDFRAEQSGAARLRDLAVASTFANPHLRQLQFPNYFPELSSEGFLVSEYIQGSTLAEWLDRDQLPYDALLDLFRIHGFFLFVLGEFHGDLHPGNVIWREGQFWFLDNANVEKVPQQFAQGLLSMLLHLGQEDIRRAAEQLADLSTEPIPEKKRANFLAEFERLYRGFVGKRIAEKSLTQQMMQTVKLAVHHGIKFPSGAFPLIKSLMYLDGMALRCNPNAMLLQDVAAFAGDFVLPSARNSSLKV